MEIFAWAKIVRNSALLTLHSALVSPRTSRSERVHFAQRICRNQNLNLYYPHSIDNLTSKCYNFRKKNERLSKRSNDYIYCLFIRGA